uniref:CKLF-like MARVEL transmembrane domain-containing protein 4 n=1 Tax=Lygus hesperus TaxID=30085 RepID=A0A0A9W091_LYGHE
MMQHTPSPPGPTTTTTVTTSNTNVQTNIRYDPSYVKTVPGMLKCVQIILSLLVFICVSFSVYSAFGRLSFMSFICGLGFWLTGILLAFYLFHVIEKFYSIPWLKIEFGYCIIWTLFLMIGSTLSFAYLDAASIFGVVGFFGYLNMIAYGYDGFLKFKGIQNNEIAQGERTTSKNTTNSTVPPAY